MEESRVSTMEASEEKTDEVVQRLLTLLKNPVLYNLRKLSDEHLLTRAEFDKMQMPAGLTHQQTWNVLNALRRQTAIELPFRDGEGRRGWYSLIKPTMADLDDIDRRCCEGSWLDLALKTRNTTYFLVEAHVDDAVTAVREDGLDIGYEKAREVLLNERPPEGPEEMLLLNGHRALWDLEEYVAKPCTPAVIRELHARVSQGAGTQATPSATQELTLWKKRRMGNEAALKLLADLVESKGKERGEHPLLLALAIRHLTMSTLPLPSWNGVMASLLMKLLFLKSRLPVLALVPIVEACRQWENGALKPPAVAASVPDAATLVDGEADYTVYVGVAASLARRKLDEVETELKRVLRRDELFARALREDLGVNHRQRSVLQTALADPEAVFRIEQHRKAHRVAYATARADLMELSERGFLERVKGGRAFEFVVAPGLRQLLSRRDARG